MCGKLNVTPEKAVGILKHVNMHEPIKMEETGEQLLRCATSVHLNV